MNIGHRVFVVEEEVVTRIPKKTFDAFYLRKTAALPQYAGNIILIAIVIYELEHRRPKRIIRIDTQRTKVRADGTIDREYMREDLRLAMNRMEPWDPAHAKPKPQIAGVVDASSRFNNRRWEHLHPKLSGPAQKRILKALFGIGNVI